MINSWCSNFVTIKDGLFYSKGQPYYFIGTNFWYAPILASEGVGGNRKRLKNELDILKSLGVTNLRILVGADAGSSNANTVKPYLQPEPGVLNDTLLLGLDYLLQEMEKREMVGVFYLTNSWDWSGGYGFYLKETGYDDSPNANGEGYDQYVKYASQFVLEKKAMQLYHNYVRRIITRTNTYTGRKYTEEPAIMSWQICNEPRPFSKHGKEAFARWISETAKLIKELDPNHLVSTGSEGLYGCEVDEKLCETIHNDANIDYLTIHIWPVNWRWSTPDRLYDALPNVYLKSTDYISLHQRMAQRINKPFVIEEFGYSRDRTFLLPGTRTIARDSFYNFIFQQILESQSNKGLLSGCNFWGWGGTGRPNNKVWSMGDDYLCDPPHEPQGWYSVYDTDSTTIELIKKYTSLLQNKGK
ncbi:MAG: beta-galactosidase [Bacteroidaceae bacterium]|nr:beta-galactosidase [Bacteroidaceae bacterium]